MSTHQLKNRFQKILAFPTVKRWNADPLEANGKLKSRLQIFVKTNSREVLYNPSILSGVKSSILSVSEIKKTNREWFAEAKTVDWFDKIFCQSFLPMNVFVWAKLPFIHRMMSEYKNLTSYLMPESIMTLGEIPIFSSKIDPHQIEQADFEDLIKNTKVIAVSDLGLLMWGNELEPTIYLLERLEYTAKISYLANKLNHKVELSQYQLDVLNDLSRNLGIEKIGLNKKINIPSDRVIMAQSLGIHSKVRNELEFVSVLSQQL
jgi:hypothetical protein